MGQRLKVLFVDDDTPGCEAHLRVLRAMGFDAEGFCSGEAALAALDDRFAGIVVSDIRLPRMSGMDLLREVSGIDSDIPVVLLSALSDVALAVQAMREGASDFLEKPFSPQQLGEVVRLASEKRVLALQARSLRDRLNQLNGIEGILVGDSQAMAVLRHQVLNLASTPADVLVAGETGTGKELVARCLHEFGQRSGRFVALNCGGLPDTLFESELFGHEAGAFSGATRRRVGQIEFANHGTLLLDEIESMPLPLQVKLLRVLQERSVQRLGSNAPVPLDIRVVAATKDDLEQAGAQGRFRADLYYRLSVGVLRIPPLRERRGDIPLLFGRFVAQAAARYGRPQPSIAPALLKQLMAHAWPGNVRELRNVADRLVLGMDRGHPLQGVLQPQRAPAPAGLSAQVDRFERTLLEEALARCGGDLDIACKDLELPKRTLYDKLRRHGVAPDRFRVARA